MRLDIALTERGLVTTRTRAKAAILEGAVKVGGKIADKPSLEVSADDVIELVPSSALRYVSRGGLKHSVPFPFRPAIALPLILAPPVGDLPTAYYKMALKRSMPSIREAGSLLSICAPTRAFSRLKIQTRAISTDLCLRMSRLP